MRNSVSQVEMGKNRKLAKKSETLIFLGTRNFILGTYFKETCFVQLTLEKHSHL